ncbi:MAG: hypothetical protein HFF03_01585 [Oscillospiraceae bacterium]|jgi:hypothetical protein|nr:hypothetical protein [Oscillospiraceae bacterium]
MDQYRDTVSFAMSTWRKVKAFQEGLRNLEQRLPMHEVRDYLASGRREEGVPADLYDEIDRLKELRSAGIQQEMPYAAAQARAAGLTLSEPVLQGYDLMAMPPLGLLKKVPSLGIYRHFVWLGEAEGGFPAP